MHAADRRARHAEAAPRAAPGSFCAPQARGEITCVYENTNGLLTGFYELVGKALIEFRNLSKLINLENK
jgi:hypothetical protein